MYCKKCGHCEKGVREDCPSCGRHIHSPKDDTGPAVRKAGHWLFLVFMIPLIAVYFMEPSFHASRIHATQAGVIGTLARPDFKNAGLVDFRVDGDTLLLEWDLRWETLGDVKQREIVDFLGQSWKSATGGTVEFRMDGGKAILAKYPDSLP